ncbi:TolC family protein [Candidatus Aminicenantes bacterium AC-708-M15]|jgi:outer membrane protein TolC|nr:TolC family protein [SCandidatus Aminicenantes bacterium Aminicenantia_JdfR_composite]MCP2604329.1 TolC family protein [Candidatus Aminicenantes bacterium AC-708-M15]
MKIKRQLGLLIPFLCFSLIFAQSTNEQKTKELHLSLQDCIAYAIENNLDLAVQIYNPELADIEVAQAKEIFMPQFSLGYNLRRTNQPSTWWLEGAKPVETDTDTYSFTVTHKLPTGGNYTLTLSGYAEDTTRAFQSVNPYYSSILRIDFTQPLLKDFGLNISRRQILIAQNNYQKSLKQLRATLIDLVYQIEEAYWNYVYSIENLKVRQKALEWARQLLEKTRREVEVGAKAPIEILSAEAEVASREADILQAEANVKNAEDLLKKLINLPNLGWDYKIVPVDKPTFERKEITLDEAIRIAFEKRPELEQVKIDIESRDIDFKYAKNQLLPSLNLVASFWSPGLSGDRLIYLNNNPFTGVIVDKIKGGRNEAVNEAFKLKYKNWSVRLDLNIPLSNLISRANFVKAKIALEQAQLQLKNLEQSIYLEVRNALREVETNRKKVEAYRKSRELAEKKLEAEEKKLSVGLSTNFQVLQYQRDLANQLSLELRAIIDYNLSLAKLQRVLGTILDEKNIKFSSIVGAGE